MLGSTKSEPKWCSKCGEPKEISGFYSDSWHKDGLSSRCKVCMKLEAMKWQKLNPERAKYNAAKSRKNNAEKMKETWRLYRLNNKEKKREALRRWRKNNPETPKGKLNSNMSRGMNYSLAKGAKAKCHWESLVDFTVSQLKNHLEKLFEPGMTWENYGTVWEIDHKIPIAAFNFERPGNIDFRLCWSLKNLRPLTAKENKIKSTKLEKSFQPSLALG